MLIVRAIIMPISRLWTHGDVKFSDFVKDFRVAALTAGIAPATYDAAMSGIRRNPHIEASTQSQPEFVKPIWNYLDSAVSPRRVVDGQRKAADRATALCHYRVALRRAARNTGSRSGETRRTMAAKSERLQHLRSALATLAYDGARTDFGRSELMAALKMSCSRNISIRRICRRPGPAPSARCRCCLRHS